MQGHLKDKKTRIGTNHRKKNCFAINSIFYVLCKTVYTKIHHATQKKLCDFIGYCLKGILNGVDITPNITLKKGIF